ncbi:MAG: glycogen debranching protein [Chloroflexi bacterium]|nr:glycogen debranching protein [Chloroflexota bacterium]
MMIQFGRDICGNLNTSESREWLVANGIGGFASGTIAGLMARRYHGSLIAAVKPPTERMYLVSQINEIITYDGQTYPLYTDRWTGGVVDPNGYQHIEQFYLEGTTPVWVYGISNALIEKRIWMQHGANTTYVQYKMTRGTSPLQFNAKMLVNYRDIHSETHANDWKMEIDPVEDGLKITAYTSATPIYILADRATLILNHDWHRRYFLMREANRGYSATEDHLNIGTFETTIHPGESVTFTLTTEVNPTLDGDYAYQLRRNREKQIFEDSPLTSNDSLCADAIHQLILAADQFIVRRPITNDPNGYTIMAGYHWFKHSIHETILNIPGLLFNTGQTEMASKLLRQFAFQINQGMLPDHYLTPQSNNNGTYTALDTTLWYIEAIRAYYETTGNDLFVRELFPALQDIIAWLNQGTHHNIHADKEDGLLTTIESTLALTWMQAHVNGKPVTPRSGKAIEINALWYNALCTMAFFAELLGENKTKYVTLSDKVRNSFARFWNEEEGYCYDVIDGQNGHNAQLRPNQLYAVSLPFSPLEPDKQKGIVDICERFLVTSHGIRSLAPDDPNYIGRYGGEAYQREIAKHQGTVWGGLISVFIKAHLKVYADKEMAKSYLQPLCNQLKTHGIGTISELFEGDPPFNPHGGIASAWSVASLLEACRVVI